MPTTINKPQQQQPQATLPPREVLMAALGQVTLLIERKNEILNGWALFQDGAGKYLSGLPVSGSTAPDAIQNMQIGLLAIAKGHAGILIAELDELRLHEVQLTGQIEESGRRIQPIGRA